MKIKMGWVGTFLIWYCALFFLTKDLRGDSSVTTIPGKTVILTVTSDGTLPLNYQWTKNGVNVTGANSNPLIFPVVGISDSGSYSVLVSNDAGSTVSDLATLSVIPSGTVTVSVNLSGAGMPMGYIETYQWLKETKTVQSSGNIYTFTDLTPHTYQVVITWHKLVPLK